MAQSGESLYERVVQVTHIYLGPAADRFIDRQIQSHVRKDPRKLTRADLDLLIDWIRVAVSLLTDDAEIVEEYIAQLQRFVQPNVKGGKDDADKQDATDNG